MWWVVGEAPEFSPESLYLVQEYMGMGTLKAIVLKQMCQNRRRLYTNLQAMEWFLQLAKGLRHLHTSKPRVIHRDLKMENILMKKREDGKIITKLSDFGLSTVVDSRGQVKKMNSSSGSESKSFSLRSVSSVVRIMHAGDILASIYIKEQLFVWLGLT